MYIQYYESFKNNNNNNIEFKIESNPKLDDITKISASIEGEEIGYITIEFIVNGFWMFEGEISEEEYERYFPNDIFAKIETLKIYDKYKGNGYSKKIIKKAIDYIKNKGEEVIYLNASPMGYGLNLNELVNLYKSFGFKTIISYPENKEMILNIK